MSAHMKTLHTELGKDNSFHVFYKHKEYVIPIDVAKKYAIKKEIKNEPITKDELFKELHDKYTKAGCLLKGLRAREGLTQVEFAKKINITQVNLSHMENGRRAVGKDIAKRIAKVFKTNPNYFTS